jgi:hypothetical protein
MAKSRSPLGEIVPLPVRVETQRLNTQAARQDQRHQIHAERRRLGGHERRGAERRVVRNRQIFHRDPAREDSGLDVADRHFAADRLAHRLLETRAELIGVEKQRHSQQGDDEQHGDRRANVHGASCS